MRVLMVNTGFLPVPPEKGGSIEMHAYHLSNELARLGNDMHFVTPVNPRASFDKGITVHEIPRIPFKFHGDYLQTLLGFGIGGSLVSLKAAGTIGSRVFDVVHIQGHIPGFCLLPFKNKSTFIFTAHNPNPWMVTSYSQLKQIFRQLFFKSVELRIIRNVDCVIAVGQSLKDDFVNRFKIPPNKVKVIPNGVDLDFFRPEIRDSDRIFTEYGLPEEYALFVGRLVEQKGLHYLLKAIRGTRIHVVLIGDGPLRSYLSKLSQRFGIVRQVHFLGAVPLHDLSRVYSQARLFVMPSLAEGLPLVGLEAIASGLPVVASRIRAFEDFVKNEYNGFLFGVGNVGELNHRLTELFNDESLARLMGERSRRIAEDQFSWKRVAEKTSRLYASYATVD